MDVIGNNIANVNTTGYKAARVDYEDAFSQTLRGSSGGSATTSGVAAMQIGSGVATGAIRNLYTQGAVSSTNVKTDLALVGEGYFTVHDPLNNAVYATRAGDFRIDGSGHLITNGGMRIQGYKDTGLDELGDIVIDLEGMLASATPPTGSSNLARSEFTDIEAFVTQFKGFGGDASTPVGYLNANLSAPTLAAIAAWDADVTAPPPGLALESAVLSDLNSLIYSGSLLFAVVPPAASPLAGVPLRPETSELLGANLDGEKLARLNRMLLEDTFTMDLEDKLLPTLASYGVDNEGKVNISLSDGSQFVRGQILLQNFRDPHMLVKEGGSLYSGMGLAGALDAPAPPGSTGLGRIQAGALELSNVDLANEFSTMITAQRAFQATARIISTSDEMLQELVNLKR